MACLLRLGACSDALAATAARCRARAFAVSGEEYVLSHHAFERLAIDGDTASA